ncbi:MAG: exo-beta-N-acetylmuramidase NamZ domain-containing protein [Dysgonomonas sp.]
MKKFYILLIVFFCYASNVAVFAQNLKLGVDRLDQLLPIIKDKRVALVVNQTSLSSEGKHLIDVLLGRNVNIVKAFAPEHGLRGTADAGEKIIDGKDSKTGVSIVSLYGKNYKPSAEQLNDIDVVIFDIQDVGSRFYTYISTMHYVMEACAENNKECIILDRPNPNDFIDGPVLNLKYRSFVGMHTIPVQHGLTIGELAKMINGEKWLKNGVQCNLHVVPMTGWMHGQEYILPVRPSPNLPNNQAIVLYPSICFFEATNVSVGRGTDFPFQIIGAPESKFGSYAFTPRSTEGAKSPLNMNKKCYGEDLRKYKTKPFIELRFLLDFYKKSGKGAAFFTNPKFMDLLSGTDALRLQIINGDSEEKIRQSWQKDLNNYKTIREKYLLYPDNG